MSGNLGLSQIAASQADKHVTSNAADDEIARAITEILSVSVASGNVTVTAAEYQRHQLIIVTGASVSGRTVTVPQIRRAVMIVQNTSLSQDIGVVRGSTTVSVRAATYAVIATDGTPNGLVKVLESTGAGASALLDNLGTTRGGLLYRGAAGWEVLAPGVSGHVLTAYGAGNDPAWAAPSGGGGGPGAFLTLVGVCILGKTADQTIPNVTETVVSWDTEVADNLGAHSNTLNNSRVTIPSGVTYVRLHFTPGWRNNSGGIFSYFSRNGAIGPGNEYFGYTSYRDYFTNHGGQSSTGLLAVTAGDYFEASVFRDGGTGVLLGPSAAAANGKPISRLTAEFFA